MGPSKFLLSNVNVPEMSSERVPESAKKGQQNQLPHQKPGQLDPVQHQTQDRLVIKESPVPHLRSPSLRVPPRPRQIPSRSVMQALPGNPSNLDQTAARSPATHELSPNLCNTAQPGPLLHYSTRDRMRLEYNIIPDPQLPSPTALFSVESAETENKRPFTGPTIAEMTVKNVDILAEFDFDSFLNQDDDK